MQKKIQKRQEALTKSSEKRSECSARNVRQGARSEKEIHELLGGVRQPRSGAGKWDKEDISTAHHLIQVKSCSGVRLSLPFRALAQLLNHARKETERREKEIKPALIIDVLSYPLETTRWVLIPMRDWNEQT